MRRHCTALIAVLASIASAAADDWPSRPVRIVSSYAAGGAADVLARIVAEQLTTAFKQQFFVEARPGAGGQIAIHTVMESPPDGYNFVLSSVSHLVMHPITRTEKLPYEKRMLEEWFKARFGSRGGS